MVRASLTRLYPQIRQVSKLKLAAAERKIAELQSQLKASQASHSKAVLALEKARNTKARKIQIGSSKRQRKSDIVEVILADVHGSKQNPAAVAAALADIKTLQPDRVVLLGDILDCGGFLAEHHTLAFVPEINDGGYEADIAAANAFLDALAQAAPGAETIFVAGNHEHRVERWILKQKLSRREDVDFLLRQFGAQHVLRLEERGIKYYPYGQINDGYSVRGWVEIDGLHFTHKVSNARGAAQAALQRTTGSIIFGDTHRQDYYPLSDQQGNIRAAWNTGCLCEPQPYYAQTRNTGWTHGYCVRFIDTKSQTWQMVQILIQKGRSMAGHIFNAK